MASLNILLYFQYQYPPSKTSLKDKLETYVIAYHCNKTGNLSTGRTHVDNDPELTGGWNINLVAQHRRFMSIIIKVMVPLCFLMVFICVYDFYGMLLNNHRAKARVFCACSPSKPGRELRGKSFQGSSPPRLWTYIFGHQQDNKTTYK